MQDVSKLARQKVSELTLAEKIAFLCANHPAVPRLGLPAYRLEAEGAHGLLIRAGQSFLDHDAPTTMFPETFGLSLTWDRALLRQIGEVIGDEARVFNCLVLFSPTIDLARDPRWGRNEEAYGEDPYLAGQLGAQYILGIQGDNYPYLKTAATAKHFYANNYEFERDWDNSVVPEQLQRDHYLRPFETAFLDAGCASMMTGYNMVNGAIGMMNPEMNTILRDEWGATGYFVSDGKAPEILNEMYGVIGDGDEVESLARYLAKSLAAGMDCFLAYDDDEVIAAVKRGMELGLITEVMIDDALSHQFTVMLRLGLIAGLPGNPFPSATQPRGVAATDNYLTPESAELVRRAANEAVVLLKNDGILPLNPTDTKSIAVIGQLGDENMWDWYSGIPPYQVTPLEGIKKEFPNAKISFDDGCDRVGIFHEGHQAWLRVTATGSVEFTGTEQTRTLFRVLDWGYGFAIQDVATGNYLTTTEDGELRADATRVWGWFNRPVFFLNKPNAYSQTGITDYPTGITGIPITDDADIDNATFSPMIPFGVPAKPFGAKREGKNQYLVPFNPGGVEKLNQTLAQLSVRVLDNGLARAAQVAQGADAAIVILGNHSLIGARECIDRPSLALPARWGELFDRVAAANPNTVLNLIAGYQYAIGSQEAKARAVLFTTHGLQEVGTAIGQTLSGANNPSGKLSQTWYADDFQFGSMSNYDIADSKLTYLYTDRPPLHPFGFGLSYTTFAYSDLHITPAGQPRGGADAAVETPTARAANPVILRADAGSQSIATVTFTLTNTGDRDGTEVPQVYLVLNGKLPNGEPGPNKALVGFDRITLKPGESRTVTIPIRQRELGFWDISQGKFTFTPGEYQFEVGTSSAQPQLEGQVVLGH